MKDLYEAAKLKSCAGKMNKAINKKLIGSLGLGPWLPSINNMLWHSFANCKGTFKFILFPFGTSFDLLVS